MHAELDARVVLDLGLCGAQHVHQRGRLPLHAGRVGAGEDQQVFVVAAHSGGQVVELEQLGQPVRVLFTALQPVEVTDEPVDQDLRAPGEVDEHGGDGGPQHGLLGRGADGLEVYGVERLGHLAELVPAPYRQRLGDLQRDLLRAELRGQRRVAQPCDRLRQAVPGHGERAVLQLAQRAVHRARHEPGDQHGDQHHARRAGRRR